MINSCIVNYYIGLVLSSGVWLNWLILFVVGRLWSWIMKMCIIICVNSVCFVVKGKVCWLIFVIFGSVIFLCRWMICCWVGVVSIGLIFFCWWWWWLKCVVWWMLNMCLVKVCVCVYCGLIFCIVVGYYCWGVYLLIFCFISEKWWCG